MKIAEIKVDYIDHCGDDLSTVKAARVSFDKESDWADFGVDKFGDEFYTLKDGDAKLINYLAKHKHKSPFNHSFISVRVKAPIFVARQLVKHKFLPWNEISRRYVDNEPEFFMPESYRAKAENVKQGSSSDTIPDDFLHFDNEESYQAEGSTQYALNYYNWLLMRGVCAEQARMFLPLNAMTEWIWSGTLGAFADMLVLRLSPYTQAETRIVAEQIRDIVQPLFPVSLKALLDNTQ